jgi:hypothetical protein
MRGLAMWVDLLAMCAVVRSQRLGSQVSGESAHQIKACRVVAEAGGRRIPLVAAGTGREGAEIAVGAPPCGPRDVGNLPVSGTALNRRGWEIRPRRKMAIANERRIDTGKKSRVKQIVMTCVRVRKSYIDVASQLHDGANILFSLFEILWRKCCLLDLPQTLRVYLKCAY